MSSGLDRAVRDIIAAIQESGRSKTSPFDRTAKVVRVDEEAGIAWVHFPGGVDETPVNLTIAATAGDTVQVRVGGGKAWIIGNATAPPTDDKTALLARIEGIEATQKAREATAKADVANDKADTATQYASDALDAASGSLVTDTLHYLATSLSSGVTIHTAGWTTTPQTISENNPYLWTYHTYTKASGTQTNTTPIIIGTYGKDGTSVTILGSYNTLAELEAAHPTGSIGDSYIVSGDLYVWNGSAWENVGQIQGPKGDKGATGTSITAVQPLYGLSTSTTVAPSTWSTSLTYETGKYIWTREKISYNNNTTGYSTAIYNQALTQACSDAMQALEVAQEVNQYTWHTETDTGAGAGLHITTIPQEDFLADPANGGSNLLAQADGLKIRNGLTTRAEFGETVMLGDISTYGNSHTELTDDSFKIVAKGGSQCFSITADGTTTVQETQSYKYSRPHQDLEDNSVVFQYDVDMAETLAGEGNEIQIIGQDHDETSQTIIYTIIVGNYINTTFTYENATWRIVYRDNFLQIRLTSGNPSSGISGVRARTYIKEFRWQKTVTVADLAIKGNITINGNSLVDYIVETGSSGIWKWNKYASGKIECWGSKTWSSVACTTSAGGGYRSADVTQALPSGLFTAIDSCQATMKGSGGSGYAMALRTLCTTKTVTQMFWNTSSATKTNLVVDYYIIGT